MKLSKNSKIFSRTFTVYLTSTQNFEHFRKKISLNVIYFRSYRLRKARLLKCLKSPVLEYPSTVNMLKRPKQ